MISFLVELLNGDRFKTSGVFMLGEKERQKTPQTNYLG